MIRTLCSAALMVPALSAAQTAAVRDWPIAAGTRVRILSPALGDQKQTGSVVSATSDTLVFLPVKQSISMPISTPNIARIEVVRGTHSRKLVGALVGFVAGAGVGSLIGSATYKKPPKCVGFCFQMMDARSDAVIAGSVLGGLGGTIVGLVVGLRQSDTWVPVAVPRQ